MQDSYDTAEWQKTVMAISQHIGLLKSWTMLIHIEDNTMRYFVGANKGISTLSNNMKGVTLRPVDPTQITPPSDFTKERLVQLPVGGNILDLREKYEVKRGKTLEWASFQIRTVNAEKAYCDAQFCFRDAMGKSYSIGRKHLFTLPPQLLAIDFLKNTKYLRKKQPKYLDIQKSLHIMCSDDREAVFEIDTFPYLPKNYYLSLDSYDFDKHSFIIGAS